MTSTLLTGESGGKRRRREAPAAGEWSIPGGHLAGVGATRYLRKEMEDDVASTDPPTSDARVTLTLDGPELTWEVFVEAGNDLTGILQEVEAKLTTVSKSRIRWVVSELSKRSPATVVLEGRATNGTVSPSTIQEVAGATASGLKALQEGAAWPPHFTEEALEKAKRLGDLIGDRVSELSVRDGDAPVTVTRQVSVNVDELIAPRLRSLGTVEGRLEAINIHATTPYATVYDMLNGHPVRAHFGRRMLSQVTAVFGKRVAVFGDIQSRPTGERYSITIRRIEALPDQADLPDPGQARGILRDEG